VDWERAGMAGNLWEGLVRWPWWISAGSSPNPHTNFCGSCMTAQIAACSSSVADSSAADFWRPLHYD